MIPEYRASAFGREHARFATRRSYCALCGAGSWLFVGMAGIRTVRAAVLRSGGRRL